MKHNVKFLLGALLWFGLVSAFDQPAGSKLWEFYVGQPVQSSAAVAADGTVYFGANNGKLYAFDPQGSGKWEFETGSPVVASPAVTADGTVLAASMDGNLYALAADGVERWRFRANGKIVSSPALGASNSVFFGTLQKTLYAVNGDGMKRWELELEDAVVSSPAVARDGTVYVASLNGVLYAVDHWGKVKWKFKASDKVNSSPAIGPDGSVYFGAFDGHVYALRSNGQKQWTFATGAAVRGSASVGPDGVVYIGSDDRKLYAFAPDGFKLWTHTTGGWVRSTPAISRDGTVYVGSYDNSLHAVSSAGTKLWEFTTDSAISASPALAANGVVYFGGWSKRFYAVKGNEGLALSAWAKFRGDARQSAAQLESVPMALASKPVRPAFPVEETRPPAVTSKAAAAEEFARAQAAREQAIAAKNAAAARAKQTAPPKQPDATAEAKRLAKAVADAAAKTARDAKLAREAEQKAEAEANLVRVRAVDQAGNLSAPVLRSLHYGVPSPLTVRVNGAGAVEPDWNGRLLEVGGAYEVRATPAAGQVFTGWSGGVTGTAPTLQFSMQPNLVIEANFASRLAGLARGVFNGLVYPTNSLLPTKCGFFQIEVGGDSSFTGFLRQGIASHPLSGRFDDQGRASVLVVRAGQSTVTLALQLDPTTGERLNGRFTDEGTGIELFAYRQVFDGRTAVTPLAGRYTFVMPGPTNSVNSPAGDAFGEVTVDGAGRVRLAGELSDGTPVRHEALMARNGLWPLHVPLHGGRGMLLGWITVSQDPNLDAFGEVLWHKPLTPQDRFYPQGFSTRRVLFGNLYTPAGPARSGGRDIGGLLSGGNLNKVVLGGGFVPATSPHYDTLQRFAWNFRPETGFVEGTFIHPATQQETTFRGALLQKRGWTSGYFLGQDHSGVVHLQLPQ